jgi:hypothetical protein
MLFVGGNMSYEIMRYTSFIKDDDCVIQVFSFPNI